MVRFTDKVSAFKAKDIKTLQVNMGLLCNQTCSHCHLNCSPACTEIMSQETVDILLKIVRDHNFTTVDITGGAPEMNPHFRYFVQNLRELKPKIEIIVRTNLTILLEKGQEDTADFFKENHVRVVASMPCYLEENVDKVRGNKAYDKSIQSLKKLNNLGYGTTRGLELDLVYSPVDPVLPPPQSTLEADCKRELGSEHGITFNNLLTIANMPIARYRKFLIKSGELESYMNLLVNEFNESTLLELMCRHHLSVSWDGFLYDCDFNQALDIKVHHDVPNHIRDFDYDALAGRTICCDDHCFGCTAGSGSSCGGSLDKHESVKAYYGKIISQTSDLKTTACCTAEKKPESIKAAILNIHTEILNKFYGCGSPIPPALAGMTVLDIGCGTGRDVYLAAQLVGEKGSAIGVDMTDEQLATAQKHIDYHALQFGFNSPNTKFKKGYIENLADCGIKDKSVDVVISNCVINLSPDKQSVFSEIFRVLKPGGELYFSDVFADRRIPEIYCDDPVLQGECLSGAMYIEDFRRMLAELGCLDYRIMSKRKINLDNPEIEAKVGMVNFYSITVRAFKIESLEDICEDYGQLAVYLGSIPDVPHRFTLDEKHVFETGKPVLVCGNTAAMIEETRLKPHFKITGNRSTHFGAFSREPAAQTEDCEPGGGCC